MTKLLETTLVTRYTERYGIPGEDIVNTLRSTAFKQEGGVSPSDEEILNLLLVADSLKLDPFLGEIKAVFDVTHGIIPVVSFEGWTKLANAQPDYDGIEITYSSEMQSPDGGKQGHVWIECAVYRKDKKHPVVVREYLDEVYVPAFKLQTANGLVLKPSAWQSHTKRQHRMKTIVQAYRTAFGFGGIYDPDEAERILSAKKQSGLVTPPDAAGDANTNINTDSVVSESKPVQTEMNEQHIEQNETSITQVSLGVKENKSLQRLKSRVEKENFSQQAINVALTYLKDRIKDPVLLAETTNEFNLWVNKAKESLVTELSITEAETPVKNISISQSNNETQSTKASSAQTVVDDEEY